MKRCRLPLAIALGALTTLSVMACGSAQRASDMLPETAVSGLVSAITEGDADGKVDGSREKANFLSTRGNKIVDSEGNEVKITGVNWFGMETGTFAPHGLWSRNWEEMLDQIAELGFNTIRLPYSSQLFDPESRTKADSIEFEINPDLEGLTGLEVMDKIIEGAGKRGLKVILDRHRPDEKAQSKLWYTEKYTEERWISDWVMLAKRYKGNDTVIGADLHNEPAGNATWGSGDPKTDWRMAAEKAGNAVLDANPDWLIIVEGIEKTNSDKDWYWMGGNLMDVAKHPINLKVPNKLVYSPHDYGPEVYMQGWFKEANYPANLPNVWDTHWGYIAKQGIAPVLLGEFGGKTVDEKELGGKWIRSLMSYLQDNSMHFTYWCINPNSGDTGGILCEDWVTPREDKMGLISKYLSPKMRVANPSQIDKSVKPADFVESPPVEDGAPPIPEGRKAEKPSADDPKVELLYKAGNTDSATNNPGLQIKVANTGSCPVNLNELEIRYWFNPDCETGQPQQLDVDWASTGKDKIQSRFVKAKPDLDYLSIKFGDGSLEPESSILVVARMHKNDWSKYDQENDYSFSDSGQEQQWERITAYMGDRLVWGTEPKL